MEIGTQGSYIALRDDHHSYSGEFYIMDTYPMKVTIRRKKNGDYTTQVSVKTPDGRVYHGPARLASEVPLATAVEFAIGKAAGRAENYAERILEMQANKSKS